MRVRCAWVGAGGRCAGLTENYELDLATLASTASQAGTKKPFYVTGTFDEGAAGRKEAERQKEGDPAGECGNEGGTIFGPPPDATPPLHRVCSRFLQVSRSAAVARGWRQLAPCCPCCCSERAFSSRRPQGGEGVFEGGFGELPWGPKYITALSSDANTAPTRKKVRKCKPHISTLFYCCLQGAVIGGTSP